MAGFGDRFHDKLPNKDCMVNQMDHFWFEILSSIHTILQSAFVRLAIHFIIVLNSMMDTGKRRSRVKSIDLRHKTAFFIDMFFFILITFQAYIQFETPFDC